MTATIYTPEDFSPIYKYPIMPDKKGWYVSSWNKLQKEFHNGGLVPTYNNMWYWDGEYWRIDDVTDKEYSITSMQDREWFGLRENPNAPL